MSQQISHGSFVMFPGDVAPGRKLALPLKHQAPPNSGHGADGCVGYSSPITAKNNKLNLL
jgi:hypothetical protein